MLWIFFSKPALLCFFLWEGMRALQLSQQEATLVNFYVIFSREKLENYCVAFFHAHSLLFSRTHFCFHRQFLRYFHGKKTNFRDGKPKIFENFHGRHFDFHGKKTLPPPPPIIKCNALTKSIGKLNAFFLDWICWCWI